ncbi:hypothetical protein VNO77_18551 [Canavalia gladiata]|uniref:Uncharacterized protein n=1 Tax=Canavalia gladiata TaxID=3824 RepID=A0AAN9LPX6_CANGL
MAVEAGKIECGGICVSCFGCLFLFCEKSLGDSCMSTFEKLAIPTCGSLDFLNLCISLLSVIAQDKDMITDLC